MRLDTIITEAADRVAAELHEVSASVARVHHTASVQPVLLARLLAHQAQLMAALRKLGVWGAVMGKGAPNAFLHRAY